MAIHGELSSITESFYPNSTKINPLMHINHKVDLALC